MRHKFELLFVGEKNPDLFSWAIQYGQRRIHGCAVNFSHVAILVDGTRVFDSTGRGFDECSIEKLLKDDLSVVRHRFELLVPEDLEDDALAWLQGRRGLPYARLQCLGVVFPILRRIPLIRNGFKRAFCSESGADFLFFWSLTGKDDTRLRERDWIDPYTLFLIAPSHAKAA